MLYGVSTEVQCSKTLQKPPKRQLTMHNHDHHPTEKKSSEYMCKIRSCLEIFSTAEELARHEREPHYKCDCGAAFFTKFELVRHKREDPCEFLVCDKCDINFFDADPASRHQYAKSKSHYKLLDGPSIFGKVFSEYRSPPLILTFHIGNNSYFECHIIFIFQIIL